MEKNHSTPGASIHKPSFLPPAIKPASTSTAAIIGSFPKGSMTSPQQVLTWTALKKRIRGLETDALSSHCTKQFFDMKKRPCGWYVSKRDRSKACLHFSKPSSSRPDRGFQYFVHSSNRAAPGYMRSKSCKQPLLLLPNSVRCISWMSLNAMPPDKRSGL